MPLIFKIVADDLWADAIAAGEFTGAPLDKTDGYIHFSTADQAQETAAKHFAGQENLLLVALDAEAFGDKIKWEVSRGGALFPHLYGSFKPYQALWVERLPLDEDGDHIFPDIDA